MQPEVVDQPGAMDLPEIRGEIEFKDVWFAYKENEWVLDLYDIEKPVSIDMVFEKDGLRIDGAAELLYDAEQDGWYMGGRVEDEAAVRAALTQAGALPA